MRNALYTLLAAATLALPMSASASAPDCYTSGFWWFERTTCTYDHDEGSITIVTDSDGDMISFTRNPY